MGTIYSVDKECVFIRIRQNECDSFTDVRMLNAALLMHEGILLDVATLLNVQVCIKFVLAFDKYSSVIIHVLLTAGLV